MGVVATMMKSVVGAGDNVGDLIGQIDAVRAKGVAASEELARLEQARLDAETFEDARAIEERVLRVRWETEHLAALLPQLEQRLAIARNANQKAAIARHAAANRKLWPKFRATIEAAVNAQAELIKMRADATAEIGEHAVTLNLPVAAFAGFLHREHFDIWTAELDRVMAEPAPKPAVAAVVAPRVAPTPARAVGVADKRVQSVHVPTEPVAPTKPKRQPRRDKVSVGGRLVVMLRSGIEIEGEQTVAGDQVSCSMEQADSLLKAGAAELVNV